MQLELVVPLNVVLKNNEKELVSSFMHTCQELRFSTDADGEKLFLYDTTGAAIEMCAEEVEETEEAEEEEVSSPNVNTAVAIDDPEGERPVGLSTIEFLKANQRIKKLQ